MSVPYLASEYGKNFEFDAPVKLLDKMMHVMADAADQQVVVVSQVSTATCARGTAVTGSSRSTVSSVVGG